MTREEFFIWLNNEFAKHPMLAKSNPKSVNELCYVLRMSDKDFSLTFVDRSKKNGVSFVFSVKEAFIASKTLAKKIVNIDFYDDPEAEYPSISVEVK